MKTPYDKEMSDSDRDTPPPPLTKSTRSFPDESETLPMDESNAMDGYDATCLDSRSVEARHSQRFVLCIEEFANHHKDGKAVRKKEIDRFVNAFIPDNFLGSVPNLHIEQIVVAHNEKGDPRILTPKSPYSVLFSQSKLDSSLIVSLAEKCRRGMIGAVLLSSSGNVSENYSNDVFPVFMIETVDMREIASWKHSRTTVCIVAPDAKPPKSLKEQVSTKPKQQVAGKSQTETKTESNSWSLSSIAGKMAGKMAEAVGLKSKPWTKDLKETWKWNFASDMYMKSMSLIDQAYKSDQKKCATALGETNDFLNQRESQITFWHLAFAARAVLDLSSKFSEECDGLRRSVLVRLLENLHRDPDGANLIPNSKPKHPRMRPPVIFFRFLLDIFENYGELLPSIAPSTNDQYRLAAFWINKCDAIGEYKVAKVDWAKVRFSLNLYASEPSLAYHIMTSDISKHKAISFCLMICQDWTTCEKLLLEAKRNNILYVIPNPAAMDWLFGCFAEGVKIYPGRDEALFLGKLAAFLDIMDLLTPSSNELVAKKLVISPLFGGSNDLDNLETLFAMVDDKRRLFVPLRNQLFIQIKFLLKESNKISDNASIIDAKRFMSSHLGCSVFQSKDGPSCFLEFNIKLCRRRDIPLSEKVLFIDGLEKVWEDSLIKLTKATFCNPYQDRDIILDQVMEVAATKEDLFQNASFEVKGKLADCFVSREDGVRLLQRPDSFRKVVLKDRRSSQGVFFQLVRDGLFRIIETTQATLASRCNFCIEILRQVGPTQERVIRLLVSIFVSSFMEWSPVTIENIISIQSTDLLHLLECLKEFRAFDNASGVSQVERKAEILESTLRKWCEDFQREEIKIEGLERVLRSDQDIWKLLRDFVSPDCPNTEEVSSKLESFKYEVDSIRSCLRGPTPESGTLSSILKAFKCKDSLVERLTSCYTEEEGVSRISAFTLQQVKTDAIAASDFRLQNKQVIDLCDYFLRNKSVLFEQSLLNNIEGKNLDISALTQAIEVAEQHIQTLLDAQASYLSVHEAAKRVADTGVQLQNELKVLMHCQYFDLTQEGIDRFRLVAIVSQAVSPLRGFISYCQRNDFRIVDQDAGFTRIMSLADGFETKTACDKESVVELLSLLCGMTTGASGSFEEISVAIDEQIKYLRFFAALQGNAEVRLLVKDMGWVDNEGLVRFRKEFDNITNVLLGNSKSYEMSVLDSVLVTVPAIAFLESCQNETSISKLFMLLKNDDSVRDLCTKDSAGDIEQVQQNSTLIRQWFKEGLDEASVFFGKFKLVCATGYISYHSEEDDGSSIGLASQFGKESPESGLVLHYVESKEGATAKCAIRGKELSEFLQNVSLIQNESTHVRRSVSSFNEQYHTIKQVCMNIVKAKRLGFALGTHKFQCKINDTEEAKRLLDDAQKEVELHSNHVDEIRRVYPALLLYWPEELHCLHQKLLIVASNESKRSLAVLSIMPMLKFCSSAVSKKEIDEFAAQLSTANDGWISLIAKFLQELYCTTNQMLPTSQSAQCREQPNLALHTISSESQSCNLVELGLIQLIFKNRLPMAFEILDCNNLTQDDTIGLFLLRVVAFKERTFVIRNLDMLEGKAIERLISFMSSRQVINCANLHCIQRQGTILRTAPWVERKEWNFDALQDELAKMPDLLSLWGRLVVDNVHVSGIRIMWTSDPGTGKTRCIRRRLVRFRDKAPGTEIGTIVIHEGTNIGTLVNALSQKFSTGAKACGVHFSFAYTPSRDEKTATWLDLINEFFMSFLQQRVVYDLATHESFHVGRRHWKIFVELPSEEICTGQSWLENSIPILASCGTMACIPNAFELDQEAQRVCLYLRAYDDGTINRKFCPQSKELIFLLDKSGSMGANLSPGRSAFSVAVDNALSIFDSHLQVGDRFGIYLFDHTFETPLLSQTIKSQVHKQRLRQFLDGIRESPRDGGTAMYGALNATLNSVTRNQPEGIESWIVCLTDGMSADGHAIVEQSLRESSIRTHLIVIGVNLPATYEAFMRHLCSKFGVAEHVTKGCYISSVGSVEGLRQAFTVVSSRIPVSRTFELDGQMSDNECRNIIEKFIPKTVPHKNMMMKKFWVHFLYRRVQVMDNNETFNYNETQDSLGSSLMQTMLEEIDRLLETDHNCDWIGSNHAQLIYDFSIADAPEFRLICTSPQSLSSEWRQQYEALNLPGFFIPTEAHLSKRSTLDRYLSQALGLTLLEKPNGDVCLKSIDDEGFILTLDFTLKMLNIHERVDCKIPCIIEGETGVSKTALTKMYAILRNTASKERACALTESDLNQIVHSVSSKEFPLGESSASLEKLNEALSIASESTIGGETEVATLIHKLLLEFSERRPSVFQPVPAPFLLTSNTTVVREFLNWFAETWLEPMFHEINVDSSLCESDIVRAFEPIRSTAAKLHGSDAVVVVFLDEINTSSVMGLMKEIVIDGTIQGNALETNIVVVAACNPCRAASVNKLKSKSRDLGREWASGHYQVSKLLPSMELLKWAFGSLNPDQEKEFVFRRLESFPEIAEARRRQMTELISYAHNSMRKFAYRCILDSARSDLREQKDTMTDVRERASSVVSLRDIQRIFSFMRFFGSECQAFTESLRTSGLMSLDATLLSVAIVYYLRLDSRSRQEFLDGISSVGFIGANGAQTFLSVLNEAMSNVISGTTLSDGIAGTRGLKENVFMAFACALSQTPLLIVGPPGSSKTLSVNTVGDNANGTDSAGEFYRQFARLSLFHYQCSRQSTSKEIASVFDRACKRQEKVNRQNHRCLVYMDEAGLPEEERESLKVLHYLLEGHISAKASVGFIAISNHVLDAAKSNRCVLLLREAPDHEEMLRITQGIICNKAIEFVNFDGDVMKGDAFSIRMRDSYLKLVPRIPIELETFFGLRDYIFFLKALRFRSRIDTITLQLPLRTVVAALERNFNGVHRAQLTNLVSAFLQDLHPQQDKILPKVLRALRHPFDVLQEAIQHESDQMDSVRTARYKLIIDCTEDDSAVRLLASSNIIDLSATSHFKLSQMPEEHELERLRLVSGVKFAASQGKLALLSQTEPVNESFYDLFNQHFKMVKGREGQISFYTNIAVGGVSRRSLVDNRFACVVQIRLSDLDSVPPPFLNRFEKYCLNTEVVLDEGWRKLGGAGRIMHCARSVVEEQVCGTLSRGTHSLFGISHNQTLDSIFISMLSWNTAQDSVLDEAIFQAHNSTTLTKSICRFVYKTIGLEIPHQRVDDAVDAAIEILPENLQALLRRLTTEDVCCRDEIACSLNSIVSGDFSESGSQVVSSIIQIVLVRVASSRLMQIVKPEFVFMERNQLPPEVVQEYLKQEHFNLKRLMVSLGKPNQQLVIVHTRTDATIHRIPGGFGAIGKGPFSIDHSSIIRDVIHEDVNQVVVEHLSLLRSASALQSSINLWLTMSSRQYYVLCVDMASLDAVDRTNFARNVIEQNKGGLDGRMVLMLLHYPSSTGSRGPAYPALFLGGWDHHFLDVISEQYDCCDDEMFFERAFRKAGESSELDVRQVSESLMKLLPRVLVHTATHDVLYEFQLKQRVFDKKAGTFGSRLTYLSLILKKKVGTQTIANLICSKFAETWLQDGLTRTIARSAEGFLQGTTKLTMAMSVQSSLAEAFGAFLTLTVVTMNQKGNLNTINGQEVDDQVSHLFGSILSSLPVPPFEELVLQRARNATLLPLADAPTEGGFPFFYFVNSLFAELLESARTLQVKLEDKSLLSSVSTTHQSMMSILKDADCDEPLVTRQRRALVLHIVESVNKSNYLMSLYLRQLSGEGSRAEFTQSWFDARLSEMGLDKDILGYFIFAKLNELEVLDSITWCNMIDRFTTEFAPDNTSAENFKDKKVLSPSTGLFDLLDYFEASVFSETISKEQWCVGFEAFMQRMAPFLLHGSCQEDRQIPCRLRVLWFLCGLIKHGVSHQTESAALEKLLDRTTSSVSADAENFVSLSSLHHMLTVSESQGIKPLSLLLGTFFSPTWTRVVSKYVADDTEYALTALSAQNVVTPATLSMLLSCTLPTNESGLVFPILLDLPSCTLKLLCQKISCQSADSFSDKGCRLCIPHYLPKWLTTMDRKSIRSISKTKKTDQISVFFKNYSHDFKDGLADACFAILIRTMLRKLDDTASEIILVRFLFLVESEAELTRHEATKLARIRSTSNNLESFCNTSMSIMLADVLLICLVMKVATELAFGEKCQALSGVHAETTDRIFTHIFEMEGMSWAEFFFGTIVRVRGEGTLAELMQTNGALCTHSWAHHWVKAVPTALKASRTALASAEKELEEQIRGEENKVREIRLCPHCGNQFSVDRQNCGAFKCGADAHGLGGQPTVGGVAVEGGYGCGRQFHLREARPYIADQAQLDKLRSDRDNIRQQCQGREVLWNRITSFELPNLDVRLDSPTLPCACAFTTMLCKAKPNAPCTKLLITLQDATHHLAHFRLLPDLIYLYMWIHMNFAYLISRTQAMALKLEDVMTEESLCSRFDTLHSTSISQLWGRVKQGLNDILSDPDFKVYFDCEELKVPFSRLENVPICMLLSEGDHPTDGNDYLFIFIRDIVGRFNNIIHCLGDETEQFVSYDLGAAAELHPLTFATEAVGASILSRFDDLLVTDLDAIAEKSLDTSSPEHTFDCDSLLQDALNILPFLAHLPPKISNPLSHLRKRFPFRPEADNEGQDCQSKPNVFQCQVSQVYFANEQDCSLVEEVCQLHLELGLTESDPRYAPVIGHAFHTFDYRQIRLLLEAIRNIYQMLKTQHGEGNLGGVLNNGRTFEGIVGLSLDLPETAVGRDRDFLVNHLHFPPMSNEQIQILFSASLGQLVELTLWCSGQLSSEGYQYSELPLSMKEPISKEDEQKLTNSLAQLKSKTDDDLEQNRALGHLNEFVQDVLILYEKEIRKAAFKSPNRSLVCFLRDDRPFCDDSDVIFATIPGGIQLRHYVSLCSLLHITKLKWIYEDARETSDVFSPDKNACDSDPVSRDEAVNQHHWLLNDQPMTTESTNPDENGVNVRRFWFQQFPPPEQLDAKEASQESSVILIQRWWQKQKEIDYQIESATSDDTEVRTSVVDEAVDPEAQAAFVIQEWWRCIANDLEELDYFSFAGSQDDDRQEEDVSMSSGNSSLYVTPLNSELSLSSAYGCIAERESLKMWLNENRLPQSMLTEKLDPLGVRSIDDLVMIIEECPEQIDQMNLAFLDQMKLKKAIEAARTARQLKSADDN